MKVAQFRKVLEAAEQMYRDSGNTAAVHSLHEISSLLMGHDAMTVSSFANVIAKLAVADNVPE